MLITKSGKIKKFWTVKKAKEYSKMKKLKAPLIVRKMKGGFERY